MNRSDVFQSFIRSSTHALLGYPLKSSYADIGYCRSILHGAFIVSISVFGPDSEESNYISLFIDSLEGTAFVGPLPFGGAA